MTLISYDADRLDALALRILDVAAVLRRMSAHSRDHQIGQFKMHDKKALEWLSQLEEWAQRGAGELEVEIVRQKAQRRAEADVETTPSRGGPRGG
ncbi:MAG: hypothetical protein R3C10_00350 [Pirellulales bacterium]